jgi:hypothetical protein
MKLLVLMSVVVLLRADDYESGEFSLESEGSEEASNFFRITGGSR